MAPLAPAVRDLLDERLMPLGTCREVQREEWRVLFRILRRTRPNEMTVLWRSR